MSTTSGSPAPMAYPVYEVRTTYQEVVQRCPELIPTSDERKTQPPDWRWYYILGHGPISWSGRSRLGKRPDTRVRNLVAKVGGSEVFRRVVAMEDTWRGGIVGKLPEEIVTLFEEAQ